MRDFRQLEIWKKSHVLTLKIYNCTKSFPKDELYGITSQLRRASLSIPTNIAEGCGRLSEAEFYRFLVIALGSANELDYLVQVAGDLNFLDISVQQELLNNVKEIKQMLYSFINKLKEKKR